MLKKWGSTVLILVGVAVALMPVTLFLTGDGMGVGDSLGEVENVVKSKKPTKRGSGSSWSYDGVGAQTGVGSVEGTLEDIRRGAVSGVGSAEGALEDIRWGAKMFPDFIQVPDEVGDLAILACEELLLSNGRFLRVTSGRRAKESRTLLIVELGNGFGGVERRGIFDPSQVKIEHTEENSNLVFKRIHKAGWGDFASSSLEDKKIFVRAPVDPMHLIEFLSSLQEYVGEGGEVQLVPAGDGWGDIRPAHGDRFVSLARGAKG